MLKGAVWLGACKFSEPSLATAKRAIGTMSQVVDIGERDPITKSESSAPAAPLPAPAPAPPTSAAMRTAFEMAPTIIRMQETLCRLRPRHVQP